MKEIEEDQRVCSYCGYKQDTPVEEAYYLKPGTILGERYMVGKVLGYGGFGVTYIGKDLSLKRDVAIKEYLPSDYATRGLGSRRLSIYSGEAYEQFQLGLESFISEAKKLAQFNDVDGIVRIYDCFQENDTGYIVMEFLTGRTVKEMLDEQDRLSFGEAKRIVIQVLEVLRKVHQSGIIHRDIAPDNIFITDSGEMKLLDFGAARYATSAKSRSLSVILKPGYAPEEQYRSHGEQGPWTDIYGLGATFYRMITGEKPDESIERMVEDHLRKPSEFGIDIPADQERALLKSLSVRKENRYQNVEDYLAALLKDDTVVGVPHEARGISSAESEHVQSERKLPGRLIAVGIAGVLLIGGVGVWLQGRQIADNGSITMSDEEDRTVSEKGTLYGNKRKKGGILGGSTKKLKSESETQSEQESQAESAAQSEQELQAESAAQSEQESQAESAAQSEEESQAESAEQSEQESQAESAAQSEQESRAESAAQSERESQAESAAQSEEESQAESAAQSEQESQAESAAQSEGESEAESAAQSERESQAESAAQSERESEAESAAQSERESQAESTAAAESEKNTEKAQQACSAVVSMGNETWDISIRNNTKYSLKNILIRESGGESENLIYDSKAAGADEEIEFSVEEGKLYDICLSSATSEEILGYYNLDLSVIRKLWLREESGYAYAVYTTADSSKKTDLHPYKVKTYASEKIKYSLTGLNIRRLPDTENGEVMTQLRLGDEVHILGEAKGVIDGEASDWYLVKTELGYGYISAKDDYTTADKEIADQKAEEQRQAEEEARAAAAAAAAAQQRTAPAPSNGGGGKKASSDKKKASNNNDGGIVWDDDGIVWE